jgi:hypothetical protein
MIKKVTITNKSNKKMIMITVEKNDITQLLSY